VERKKKICKKCGNFRPLFSKGLCLICYKSNYKKPIKTKKKYDPKVKERDVEFYSSIWETRPHNCENCGAFLGNEPRTYNFHHLLPKAKYPEHRYDEWNIALLCADCHQQTEISVSKTPKLEQRKDILLRKLDSGKESTDTEGSS